LSASAPSSHDLSLAAFTIKIAEFDFRHTQGIDQYQPIEKRRLLHERLIRTMWSNVRLFRGEARRKSAWQFGD
jgi:hypothetical protein